MRTMIHTIKQKALNWFETILAQYRQETKQKEYSEYELYVTLVEQLNPQKFAGFNNAANSHKKLYVVFDNIEKLINHLYFYNTALLSRKIIYSGVVPQEHYEVNVGSFFLSDDKRYVEEHILIEQFINVSSEFIKNYQEKSKAVIGEDAHNCRVLLFFKNHLSTFTQQLLEVQI